MKILSADFGVDIFISYEVVVIAVCVILIVSILLIKLIYDWRVRVERRKDALKGLENELFDRKKELRRLSQEKFGLNESLSKAGSVIWGLIAEIQGKGNSIELSSEMAPFVEHEIAVRRFDGMIYAPVFMFDDPYKVIIVEYVEHLASRWERGLTGYSDKSPIGTRINLEDYEEMLKKIKE